MSELIVADPSAVLAPRFSQEDLAQHFSEKYACTLKFISDWGRWMIYEHGRWRMDNTRRVLDLVRALCRSAAAECSKGDKLAAKIASAATVKAVEQLATSDRRHAATPGDWDLDPKLLNTPNGTVDLTTGRIRPHNAGDHITRMTAAAPGGGCPEWLRFLARCTNGNAELQAFLQRVVGYCLTGLTTEQVFFFFHGIGSNGKSTFINVITGLLGDYATTAPISAFTAARAEQHPTDMAGLRGARLVTAIETESGRCWAESKLKTITGGDKYSARLMRQDFFVFTPSFKIIIVGNHKPGLQNADESMRRRLHLVPFRVSVPREQWDLNLADRLRAEWPGILGWAIEGCLEWQKVGLNPPSVVLDATAEYFASEDCIGRWIEECCERGLELFCPTSELFRSWRNWCERNGEHAESLKKLSQALETRAGLHRERTNAVRGFRGIDLKRKVTCVTDVTLTSESYVMRTRM